MTEPFILIATIHHLSVILSLCFHYFKDRIAFSSFSSKSACVFYILVAKRDCIATLCPSGQRSHTSIAPIRATCVIFQPSDISHLTSITSYLLSLIYKNSLIYYLLSIVYRLVTDCYKPRNTLFYALNKLFYV